MKTRKINDSLFSNTPFISLLEDKEYKYIIAVKPGNHSYLFGCLETYKKEDRLVEYNFQDEKFKYKIKFINSIYLNSNEENIVNYIQLEEENKKGEKKFFSWVTNLPINGKNCFDIARGGRAKWHIENETFNTLKNQGYHFSHNFGHGYKHLCNVFGMLMMLAFFVDQLQQACCHLFQKARNRFRSRINLWEDIRSLFLNYLIETWDDLFHSIIYGYDEIILKPNTS